MCSMVAHGRGTLKLAPPDPGSGTHGDLDFVAGNDWLTDFVTKNTTPEVAAQMAAGLQPTLKVAWPHQFAQPRMFDGTPIPRHF